MANIQGFGIQLATGGFSLEANTIFATYAEALAYAQSSAAYVGKVISITSGEQKGTYSIEAVGADAAIKKLGSDIDLSNYVTKDQITNLYTYKGSKATYEDLPVVNSTGDVWNVEAAYGNNPAGTNYAWTGTEWDALAGSVDLSGYSLKSEVNAAVEGLNQTIAENTGKVNALGASLEGKVDKVDGQSLIPNDKLALIDTHQSAIGSLTAKDENFETRLSTIEKAFTGEGGTIDLSDITTQLGNHNTRLTSLESDNTTNKQDISDLKTQVGGYAERLTAIETLNTEQSNQLQGLTERVVATEQHGTAITNLTTAVNKNTEDIGKINSAIGGLAVKSVKADEKVLFADAAGALGTVLKLNYDSDNHKIQILGKDDVEVAFLDATAFIKDGMLDNAVYNADTKKITLTWNTAAGKEAMDVDLTGLVDTYTNGSGLALSGNVFSVVLSANDNNKLTLAEDGLLVDISEEIEAINKSIDNKINAAFTWIDVTAAQ